MESENSFRFGANAQLGTRSVPLEIDLNETPLPSPREAFAGDGVFTAEAADGVPPGEVRCSSCGRVLHMSFLGTSERKCLECVSRNGSDRLRSGGLGLLDMNASPPREPDAEEEGVFFGGESLGRQALEQDREHNGGKMQVVHNTSFVGHSFNAPVTYSNLLHSENGYNFHTASRSVTSVVKSGLEVPLQHRLNFESSSKETDLSSTLQGKLWASYYTPPNYIPQSASEVYLQTLREYIFERKGVLGDGWHVKFDYCQSRCKTFVVYCAPDGSRFESMADVARHLRLPSNFHSLETEERGNGFALAQKESHSNTRGKETSRSLRANSYKDGENNPRSKSFRIHYPHNDALVPPGFDIMAIQARKYSNSRSAVELDRVENSDFGSLHFNDGFPVQFEDFLVLSVGKIDPRPSYHNTSQIWPVAYKSSWHDKITGSLFVCEVSDGGDLGPVFKVRRCPCTTQSITDGSTILSRPKVNSFDGKDKVGKGDSAIFGIVDDENTDIQMILAGDIPPNLDDDILSCSRKRTTENYDFQRVKSDCYSQVGRGDVIGEFEVEGRSSSFVWEMVSQTLLHACHESYQQNGAFQFLCKHDMEGRDVIAMETIGSLSKFCYLAGPTNIPCLIQSTSELDACCKMLAKWLQQDRFGLDVEFVQELIEQLPGVNSCSEYKFLSKRGLFSTLQTVASGFLLAKRKSDVQGEKGLNDFLRSCRRPRKDCCPVGKPLSSNLPAYLIGDALQVWEFLQRFSEVLGLETHFSFQELECEFINPWLDSLNPLGKPANKNHCALIATETESNREVTQPKPAFHTHSRCTGTILSKAHSKLLKVVIGELLLKVATYVDPNFDAGECKSRRGRKKDADNSVTAKKTKLDMLTVNELTWPELARRYILAVLSMEGILDSTEITCRESGKVFHCLQGDGGTLCGSPTGVAAMEADALLLAEASKRVFGFLKTNNDIYSIDIKESDKTGASENSKVNDSEVPEWAEALEPVRKLPTNVGARIRKCVYEALRRNPPEWAKDKLEHSISKEVYKGNASGPTKRAVVEVLGRVRHESPQHKPEKKEKGKNVSTLSDLVVKQCRNVLRKTAAEDEEKAFCNLLGKTLRSANDNDDVGLLGYPAMVARPLDFRSIDIRLAAGTYGVSHEAFLEDVREVWHNIRTAYWDQSDFIDLAETLSLKFEDLYENEVLTLVQKIAESGYPNCPTEEAKKDIDDMLIHASESTLLRAPWDEGVCKVCGLDKDDDNVLLCDVCDSEYHTYCLNPPLARIPEGNWYCPSCVAEKLAYRSASRGTQINRCKKNIHRGELVDNILEGLTKLAHSMELKEYWEFTVEERIFLFRFLCDEALNSAIIRDHLDQCATLSSDLQQKLRTLNSERKNLMFREEVMAANMAKGRINMHNGEVETGSDALASLLSNDVKFVGPLPNRSSYISSFPANINSQQESNHDGCNGSQIPANQDTPDHSSFDPIGTNKAENIPSVYANVSQAYKPEASSLKNEISCLHEKITTLESELFKVQVRKEFLGRDSAGRPYWVVDGPGICPQVVVNGSVTAHESKGKEPADPTITNPTSWTCYESDTEIGGLVEWLSDNDPRERELRESILQWQRSKSKGSKDVEKHSLHSSNDGKALDASFLVTKALTALEKKFAPCLETRENEGRMYSCECLEPLWPSRPHCLSCHQTFSSGEDLERHNDVTCSTFSPSHENSEVNEDSSKGKRTRTETPVENCPDDGTDVKATKNEKHDNRSGFAKYQNDPECPFDFEEIKAKFVTQNSLKELVKDIGLIGSNGTPSFVPGIPPYLSDPALSLVPTVKNDVNPCDRSTDLEDQQQQSKTRANVAAGVSTENISHSSSKCVENGMDEETSRVERSKSKSISGKEQFLSVRNKIAVLSSGKCRVIRESSLKPLAGRVSEILRLLKKNLLDMDAALPEDALRPSRVNPEKRCAWRAFVKSAASIYEMSQATILLEDMIKTEYLKNDWWYWSTPSAAANISTLSALALRIYTLDAAIIYKKPSSSAGPTAILKQSCKPDKGSLRNSNPGNNVKSSSSPVLKASDSDPADNSKSKTRSSKKRRDSGG